MRILMVMAHPDDEVIFGWPVLQHEWDISLITLSNNRERHGVGTIAALEEVCAINEVRYLPIGRTDNNFYRLPPRYESFLLRHAIEQQRKEIGQAIELINPDCLFTHNPWGEYGHGDHRFTSALVAGFDLPLMMTNICIPNPCHLSYSKLPKFWDHVCKSTAQFIMGPESFYLHTLEEDWYERMKAIYERHNAWSWSGHSPVKSCLLWEFK